MKEEEYRKVVSAWKASGQTMRAYSAENGIAFETLKTWNRRTRAKQGIRRECKSYGEYREIVLTVKSSGIPAIEWCEANGVNLKTFYGWSKKVNRKEGRETIDALCGIDRKPKGRQPEQKITENPTLCELRR